MLKVKASLPDDERDAYFQLVEHPILALSNLYQLYYAVAWNRRLAAMDDSRANAFADRAQVAFQRDQEITDAYHALNGGKWNGMMLQTHIGYTSWQEPKQQIMPEVKRVPARKTQKPIIFSASGVGRAQATNGDVIAFEAPHFTKAVGGAGLTWRVIPHLGRTLGAVTTFPQSVRPTTERDGVRLEYQFAMSKGGDLAVKVYMVPTLDTTGKGALRTGISLDGGHMQTLIDQLEPAPSATTRQPQRDWNKAVKDNARILEASFPNVRAGRHVINVWRLDGNCVLQKLVLATGPISPSYLGPREITGSPDATLQKLSVHGGEVRQQP